jgi:hypothetical protein
VLKIIRFVLRNFVRAHSVWSQGGYAESGDSGLLSARAMIENGGTDEKQHVSVDLNQYNSLYHRIYILALPLVAGAVAAISTWKDDHLFALLILATFVAVASIYEMHVRGWSAWPIVAFCVVCYVLAWVAFQIVGPNLPIETDKEVYLIPGNKPAWRRLRSPETPKRGN